LGQQGTALEPQLCISVRTRHRGRHAADAAHEDLVQVIREQRHRGFVELQDQRDDLQRVELLGDGQPLAGARPTKFTAPTSSASARSERGSGPTRAS
jgi:hypothetical protein